MAPLALVLKYIANDKYSLGSHPKILTPPCAGLIKPDGVKKRKKEIKIK